MSEEQFQQLFNDIDNGFVGDEESAYHYQKGYAGVFDGGSPVLDIGCGQGAFLRALNERGVESVGLDMNPKNIEFCKDKGYSVIQADAFSYLASVGEEHKDGLYGGMSMFHMIEHFDGETAVRLLVLMHEALKQGGKIAIITPNFAVERVYKDNFWLSSTHVRPYPEKWLLNALRHIGFDIVALGSDANSSLFDTYIVGVKR
jgi:2-polyprenyl-3-methyl-5-hydroxy-6-metoxy-1,4-benzoquinol methylase